MTFNEKILGMGKRPCYNALKVRRERHSEGKKWVRGRREPPDAEGDQLRGVRGVLHIKSKIGAGGSLTCQPQVPPVLHGQKALQTLQC